MCVVTKEDFDSRWGEGPSRVGEELELDNCLRQVMNVLLIIRFQLVVLYILKEGAISNNQGYMKLWAIIKCIQDA